MKYKPKTNISTKEPDTVTSSLVLSSNINWGQIGFLLIKLGDDASNFSIIDF